MKWKKSNSILVLLWKQFCPCGPLEGVLGIPMGPQTTLWKAMLSAMVVQGWSPGPLYQHHLGTCQKCKFSGFKPQTYRLRTCGRWSPTIWVSSSPASDSDAHWGLRTTVLYLTEEAGQQGKNTGGEVVRNAFTHAKFGCHKHKWKAWNQTQEKKKLKTLRQVRESTEG